MVRQKLLLFLAISVTYLLPFLSLGSLCVKPTHDLFMEAAHNTLSRTDGTDKHQLEICGAFSLVHKLVQANVPRVEYIKDG